MDFQSIFKKYTSKNPKKVLMVIHMCMETGVPFNQNNMPILIFGENRDNNHL